MSSIYVFQAEGTHMYKIGITTRAVEVRRRELSTGNHCELIHIAHWPATQKDEKALHYVLRQFWRKGEWYELTLPTLLQALSRTEQELRTQEGRLEEGEFGPVEIISGAFQGQFGMYLDDVIEIPDEAYRNNTQPQWCACVSLVNDPNGHVRHLPHECLMPQDI